MKYKEYLKGSKTLREKIKNNPEMKMTEEDEKKNMQNMYHKMMFFQKKERHIYSI